MRIVFVHPLSIIMLQTNNVWGKRGSHRSLWCVGDNIRAHGIYLHLCYWSGNLCVSVLDSRFVVGSLLLGECSHAAAVPQKLMLLVSHEVRR